MEIRPLHSAGGSLMGPAQATFSASTAEVTQLNFLSIHSSCYRGDKHFTRIFTTRPVWSGTFEVSEVILHASVGWGIVIHTHLCVYMSRLNDVICSVIIVILELFVVARYIQLLSKHRRLYMQMKFATWRETTFN